MSFLSVTKKKSFEKLTSEYFYFQKCQSDKIILAPKFSVDLIQFREKDFSEFNYENVFQLASKKTNISFLYLYFFRKKSNSLKLTRF